MVMLQFVTLSNQRVKTMDIICMTMYVVGYVYNGICICIYRYLILCVHNMGIHEQKHGATMEVGLFFLSWV